MTQDDYHGSLAGQVAWITGGSSGIGAAAAEVLAARGARVGVLDLAAPTADIPWASCDLADPAAVAAATRTLTREIGPADILVTSAGINLAQPVTDHPTELWNKVISVNLSGTFYMVRECLPGMIERRWGRVVTVSASGGVRVLPGRAAYGSSKAGVIALTKAVAHEGAAYGVTANSVAPGLTDTPMAAHMYDNDADTAVKTMNVANPMKVLLEPSDIAHGIAYFCSPEARHVTGQLLHINAGAVM